MPSWLNPLSSEHTTRHQDLSASIHKHEYNNSYSHHTGYGSYTHPHTSSKPTNSPYTSSSTRYRDVSPVRSSHHQSSNHYNNDGTVSPLGTSRFEQPSPYSTSYARHAQPQRQARRQTSHAIHQVRENPQIGQVGYYGKSQATGDNGISRRTAVRGRVTGYSGGVGDVRRGKREEQGRNFGGGEVGRWERY